MSDSDDSIDFMFEAVRYRVIVEVSSTTEPYYERQVLINRWKPEQDDEVTSTTRPKYEHVERKDALQLRFLQRKPVQDGTVSSSSAAN